MAQPPPYVPATSFISYQAQQSWFPGQQLDAEFNNLDTIIGDIEANLALIQRDDGTLINTILTVWASGIRYGPQQVVIVGAGIYTCRIANTSSASFATDLAAGFWSLSSTIPTVAGTNGVLSNTRLAKTANYTLANTDKGCTVALGDGFFTLTVNAASGYDANFAVIITNESASRGKFLAINGITAFILWPLQTVILFNGNNTWNLSPFNQPWCSPNSISLFIDNVLGSDVAGVTDGLSTGTGAFATVAHAISVAQQNLFPLGNNVTFNLPLTTSTPITEQVDFSGVITPGYVQWGLVGNVSNPALCQWQLGNAQSAIQFNDYFSLGVRGIAFSATGSNCTFINGSHGQNSILDVNNCIFGTNAAGIGIAGGPTSTINVGTGITISGNAAAFLNGSEGANIQCNVPIAISGTPNLTYFILLGTGSQADISSLSFTGATTAITGQKFYAQQGSKIFGDSAVTWPVHLTAGQTLSGSMSDGVGAALSTASNVLAADVALNNTALYFDGPSMAQGTVGTWFVSGTVTLSDSAGGASFYCKLWDGTTTIASSIVWFTSDTGDTTISLSGIKTNPAGNIRISCRDISSTNGKIAANDTGLTKDSTIWGVRIG